MVVFSLLGVGIVTFIFRALKVRPKLQDDVLGALAVILGVYFISYGGRQKRSPLRSVVSRVRRPAARLFAAARDRHHRMSPRPFGRNHDAVEVALVAR